MKAVAIFAFAIMLAAAAAGQVTSPPPLCFAFNDAPSGPVWASQGVNALGFLTVHFAAPSPSLVERIDLFGPGGQGYPLPPMTVDLCQTSALGVPPAGAPLGSFIASGTDNVWNAFMTSTPVQVAATATYAVTIRVTPYYSLSLCIPVNFDPGGPQPLPYQLVNNPSWCQPSPMLPPAGFPLMIRFRGSSCALGPSSGVEVIGIGCGQPSGPPFLSSWTLPTLGLASWPISAWAATAGAPAYLFWSHGVNPAGSLVSAGSPCLHYLDPTSLATNAQLGTEPLAAATTDATGSASWSFAIPADPALAGVVFGAQTLLVSAVGTIPLGGGVFGQTTNALRITLGY